MEARLKKTFVHHIKLSYNFTTIIISFTKKSIRIESSIASRIGIVPLAKAIVTKTDFEYWNVFPNKCINKNSVYLKYELIKWDKPSSYLKITEEALIARLKNIQFLSNDKYCFFNVSTHVFLHLHFTSWTLLRVERYVLIDAGARAWRGSKEYKICHRFQKEALLRV